MTPDQPFLEFEGRRWSYAEADKAARELSAGLARSGLTSGDHVGVLLPSCDRLVVLVIACIRAGLVLMPLVPNLSDAELASLLAGAKPRALVSDERGISRLRLIGALPDHYSSARPLPGGLAVVAQPGHLALRSERREADMRPAFLMFTSGSTARPKGALLPSGGFVSSGVAWANAMGVDEESLVICVLPIQYAGPLLMQLAGVIAAGAALVVQAKFSASRFWDDVRATRATHAVLPFAIASILSLPDCSSADRSHTLLRVSGDRLPKGFAERFGITVQCAWAMTELSAMGSFTDPCSGDIPAGCIGRPSPPSAEIEIRNTEGTPCPTGESGEIWFRHPHVMIEYFGDLRATEMNKMDGWVRTGDLGHIDAGGCLHFDGRLKNVVKRSGSNISAEEVEQALRAHPDIVDCVVVGVDDPIRGEDVHALVQPRTTMPGIFDLLEHAKSAGLSPWKFPGYLQTVSSLPTLTSGKVDRRAAAQLVDTAAAVRVAESDTRYNAAG